MSRRTQRAAAVGAAVVAAVLAWAVGDLLPGVDMLVPAQGGGPPEPLGAAAVAISAASASLAGWGSLALLERFTSAAGTWWPRAAVLALLLSLIPPLTVPDIATADRLVLIALHAVVAAVLVPALARSASEAQLR